MKIWAKSIQMFLSYFAHIQTDKPMLLRITGSGSEVDLEFQESFIECLQGHQTRVKIRPHPGLTCIICACSSFHQGVPYKDGVDRDGLYPRQQVSSNNSRNVCQVAASRLAKACMAWFWRFSSLPRLFALRTASPSAPLQISWWSPHGSAHVLDTWEIGRTGWASMPQVAWGHW